ncbi:unnamed protein product, partial [Sphagnum balticum]
RLIKNLSFERIAGAIGNVIIGKCDDLILVESSIHECLVCMINVCLMAIISPGIGASH